MCSASVRHRLSDKRVDERYGLCAVQELVVVVVEVVERGPTVLVSVEHDVTGAPETSAMISPVGWSKPFSRLKTLLETGEPMAWPEEEARSASAVTGDSALGR